ncbi:MAG: CPBP family intramembrane glutamic endopeptidase [Planctomycetota bacterium]
MDSKRIAAVVFALVVPTVVTLVYFVWLKEFAPGAKQIAYAIGKSIQFGFPLLFVWVFDRTFFNRSRQRDQSVDEALVDNGPGNPAQFKGGWLTGTLFGFAVAIAIPTIYFLFIDGSSIAPGLLERVKEKTAGNGIDSTGKFIALGVFYALCHSFLEEYYWRWFVFGQLKKLVSVSGANIISSLGFMAHHVVLLAVFFESWTSPLTWLFSAGICIGGIFWAWLYEKTGSLKVVWISHLLVDAGIFFLGYLLLRGVLQQV